MEDGLQACLMVDTLELLSQRHPRPEEQGTTIIFITLQPSGEKYTCYNHALQLKSKACGGSKTGISDIVSLKNNSVSRIIWKLAKVKELLPGRDGPVKPEIIWNSTPTVSA